MEWHPVKRYLAIAIAACAIPVGADAAPKKVNDDISFKMSADSLVFFNACTNETVLPRSGQTIQGVFKLTVQGSDIRILNHANGMISGYGVSTYNDYTVSAHVGVMNTWNTASFHDGSGVLNLNMHVNMVNNNNGRASVAETQFKAHVMMQDGRAIMMSVEPESSECRGV